LLAHVNIAVYHSGNFGGIVSDEEKCQAAMNTLGQIERGEVTIIPDGKHQCHSDLGFAASNGWSFTVFCDGGWDYVDRATMPDGTIIRPFEMPFEISAAADCDSPINQLRCYLPDRPLARAVWGFSCMQS
jgi:hypothetical protein